MSRAEVLLWSTIRKKAMKGARFRRQHPIGPYVADFGCIASRLVVEIDGATHWTEEEQKHDRRRTAFMQEEGWTIVRVTNADVYERLDGVWLAIACHLTPPSPSLRSGPPPYTGEE